MGPQPINLSKPQFSHLQNGNNDVPLCISHTSPCLAATPRMQGPDHSFPRQGAIWGSETMCALGQRPGLLTGCYKAVSFPGPAFLSYKIIHWCVGIFLGKHASALPGASVRNLTRDKVMRKEAWQNARMWSGFRGSPWYFPGMYPPKNQKSVGFCSLLFWYSLEKVKSGL